VRRIGINIAKFDAYADGYSNGDCQGNNSGYGYSESYGNANGEADCNANGNANGEADCNTTYPTCRRLGDTRLPPTIVLLGTPDFFGSPCLFQLSRPSGSSRLSALWALSPPDIIQARGTRKSSPARKREVIARFRNTYLYNNAV
jgi:hypothetical protein